MLRDWRLLNKPKDAVKLDDWANELEKRSSLSVFFGLARTGYSRSRVLVPR
jgi:hypothetical protein